MRAVEEQHWPIAAATVATSAERRWDTRRAYMVFDDCFSLRAPTV